MNWDLIATMIVAVGCAGFAGGIIGYVVGSVRQMGHYSKVVQHLRERLKEETARNRCGFNGKLEEDNQWFKEST